MAGIPHEILIRQADLQKLQTVSGGVTAAAPNLAAAIANLSQLASALTAGATQLTRFASAVTDPTSARQQVSAGEQTWSQMTAQEAQLLQTPRQAWASVNTLLSEYEQRLLLFWDQSHSSPPPTPTAVYDTLAQAMSAYATFTAQLSQQVQAATAPPPPPTLPVDAEVQAARAWLQARNQTLSDLASQLTAAADHLANAIPWSGVQAQMSAVLSAAEAGLAAAQRVNAGVSGSGSVDAAALSGLLGDLTDVRISAWPYSSVPEPSLYQRRMAELDQALEDLLAFSTGAPASMPAALLPVRLETRSQNTDGLTEFRVRIYVDNIHVDAHDLRLTDDEKQWSDYLRNVVTTDPSHAQAAWAQVAGRFGAARAAYLLHPDPAAGTRPSSWSKPAIADALPDRWLVVGYGPDGTPLAAALGAPISTPVQVGPDPTATPQSPSADELAVDPGMAWMVDFDKALDNGMGVLLRFDPGVGSTPTLSRLVAVGIGSGDGSASLDRLLAAHHYTDGLAVEGSGTPTNNTSTAPSGFESADPGYQRSYALEVVNGSPSTGDAVRLAAALGCDPALLKAAGAPLQEQDDQQAMTALTWPSTWGSFLAGPLGLDPVRVETLRSWAVAWLRPAGPLPTLRLGSRPYGFLPVLAMDQWTDPSDAAAADVHRIVSALMNPWKQAASALAASMDFDSLLARRPVSINTGVRFSGIMPGWLDKDYGILEASYGDIEGLVSALPGRLSQIGSALGLAGSLNWPAGAVVLPDPAGAVGPWPLIVPDGNLALTAGTQSQPAGATGYLATLTAETAAAKPAALLDILAHDAWAGSGAAESSTSFVARGSLGEAAEPAAPSAADEVHAAVTHLSARTDADFDDLLGGALDATAHRLDAWATALATRRLGALRATQPTGTIVGGFGWVENLVTRPVLANANLAGEPDALADPANAGYLQAPSLQQATTAAVLRSGYLTHQRSADGASAGSRFAIDLSSSRARLAGWLLDGVRQGQPLAALLGYRFERALQEADLAQLIAQFRQIAPYDPATNGNLTGTVQDGSLQLGNQAADPAEAVRAGDVVDGVTLLALWHSSKPPQGGIWDQAKPTLDDLGAAMDAVSDAILAEALHHSLTGNTAAAAATIEGVATGSVPPPELQFLSTPRTGIGVSHRVLVPLSPGDGSPPAGWPDSPRGRAEPALNAWAAGLLGNPSETNAAVELVDPSGVPLAGGATPITLSTLGLGPLDVVALAGKPEELEKLAVYKATSARNPADPVVGGGSLDATPAGAQRPLAGVLAVARSLAQLIGTGRGADARDILPQAGQPPPGADLNDLAARVSAASQALEEAQSALAAAIPGGPPVGNSPGLLDPPPAGADPHVLASALAAAVPLGIPHAAPVGTSPSSVAELVGQARAAWKECSRRLTAIHAAEPAAPAAPPAGANGGTPPAAPDQATTLAARLSQLGLAFGGGFQALPRITLDPPDLLAKAVAATETTTADPGQSPMAWIFKAGQVHPPVADLLDTCCAAEALGTGPELALTVGQLPLPASPGPAPWVGLPFEGAQPPANVQSLAMLGSVTPPAGPLCALLVSSWIEVIPSAREITGVTYHYDAPTAQAPQTVLLAVPARSDATEWHYSDLLSTIGTALDLAHVRSVDYGDLPPLARLILPAAYFPNPNETTPALPGSFPTTYLQQVQQNAQITSVSPVNLQQSKSGQIVVIGTNFAQLTPAAFSIDGTGVTVTGGTITDTTATLDVTVDANAPLGQRGVKVGIADFASAPISIGAGPRATACDTTLLVQGLQEKHTTVTVSGQGLTGASATISGSEDVSSTAATTDSHVTLNVTVAASTAEVDVVVDSAGKPHPIQPTYAFIPLALTVTPVGGPTATFHITLDALV